MHCDWRNSYGLLQIPSVYQSSRPEKTGLLTRHFIQLGQPYTHLKLLALPATSGFEWDMTPQEEEYSITTAKETGYATKKDGKVNIIGWDFTSGKQDKEIPGKLPGLPSFMNFFKSCWLGKAPVCQLAATAHMTCYFFIAHCDTVVSVLTDCTVSLLPCHTSIFSHSNCTFQIKHQCVDPCLIFVCWGTWAKIHLLT